MKMGEQLESFCKWYLEQPRRVRPPCEKGVHFVEGLVATVIYRSAPFQVELVTCSPNLQLPDHTHPNVDSFELYLSGALMFSLDGKQIVPDEEAAKIGWDGLHHLIGTSLRVPAGAPHGLRVGLARLHTSLWLVPKASRLLAAARHLEGRFKGVGDGARELDAFRPVMFPIGGIVHRLDTGAAIYQAFPADCRPFTASELDRYDHLIAGSHLDWVAPVIEDGKHLAESHAMAQRDLGSLRGAWRAQEAVFQKLAARARGSMPHNSQGN